MQRRERYKRYAAGVRDDVPVRTDSHRRVYASLTLAFFGIGYVVVLAPTWFEEGVEVFDDPHLDCDSKGSPLVEAWHNPCRRFFGVVWIYRGVVVVRRTR